MLKFFLLGTPVIQQNSEPLSTLNESPISLRVLSYLVYHRQQPIRRDILAATFWPDLSDKRSRQTLSNIVWRMRNGLQDAADQLLVTNTAVQFNPNIAIWLDVDLFDETSGKLLHNTPSLPFQWISEAEQTLELYRGDFLAGIEDEWCLAKREALRHRYQELMAALIEQYQAIGDRVKALYWAKRAYQSQPDSEAPVRKLIELYIQTGNQLQAQQTFEEYERACKEMSLTHSVQLLDFAKQQGLRLSKSRRRQAELLTSSLAQSSNPEYIRRELEIRRKNDELFDLMADRQMQDENLLYMQALADKLHDPVAQIDLLARRAWLATRKGDYVTAIALAQEALRIADQAKENRQRSLLHRLLGVASEESGDFKSARHHYVRAMVLDDKLVDSLAAAINLNNVAAVTNVTGNFCEAITLLQKAETLLNGVPIATVQAKIAGNQALSWMKLGQYQQAARYLQKAQTYARNSGERDAEWWIVLCLIQLYACQNQVGEALKFAHQQYDTLQVIGDSWTLTAFASELASLYIRKHNGEEGGRWAQQALNHSQQQHQWIYQFRSHIHLAEAALLLQQNNEAFSFASFAVKLFEQKKQTLADAPLLYDVYAQCAHAIHNTVTEDYAIQQYQKAVQEQIDLIPSSTLRDSFKNLWIRQHDQAS
ncbi:MAG: BTAD domain-containing putative transcriptional regulator [Caldilineaceae bacterium]